MQIRKAAAIFILTFFSLLSMSMDIDTSNVSMTDSLINDMIDKIENGRYGKHEFNSVLIQINGKLICEEYFNGYSRDAIHFTASVQKSILSIMIGIAIDKGFIRDEYQKILDYFPEFSDIKNLDDRKRALTIKDLLICSAGFQWTDETDFNKLTNSDSKDWIKSILDLPMTDNPGKTFNYSTAMRVILSGIIKKTTGMNTLEFGEKYLFEPLDIDKFEWLLSPPNDIPKGGDWVSFRPIDLLKFGQLYLNNGIYENDTIVSKEWIRKSTTNQIKVSEQDNYGYQWWVFGNEYPAQRLLNVKDGFHAKGAGGQFIWVIPHLKLVVVTTGRKNGLPDYSEGLLWDSILPIVKEYIDDNE